MDEEEFENAFSSEDKELWRKMNRSGAFRKRKKASKEDSFHVVEEEQKRAFALNINDHPSTSTIFEDNETNLYENDLREDILYESDADVECDFVNNDDLFEENFESLPAISYHILPMMILIT